MTSSKQRTRPRRWLAACSALVLILLAGLIPATSVAAAEPSNMVLVWNANAINAITNAPTATPPGLGQPPPLAPIHLAMVQGAVYDAVNAIDRKHDPYLRLAGLPNGRARASKAAAVATAAHHVLVGLDTVPAMPQNVRDSLDSLYRASLAQIKNNRRKTEGIKIGAIAARAMLAERAGDGRFGTLSFAVSDAVGKWRPVPPLSNNVFAWISLVDPFTLTRPDQFRSAGPLEITSHEYAVEFNEVKALGGKTSSRTTAQNDLANFVSVSPVGLMNRALREIAMARGLTTSQQASLFVRTSMSSADALIGCWDDKFARNFWRPYTAIRNATLDGNPETTQQDDWETLFPTPGYPDHPSGYNCFAAGLMYAAKAYFGTDNMSFQLTSPGTNPPTTATTRSYTRFSDVTLDAIEGRMLIGLHFRTPDVQGAKLGQDVAEWVAAQYFGPAH
jgi:hypothetical protein